jgi:hypothetical protein
MRGFIFLALVASAAAWNPLNFFEVRQLEMPCMLYSHACCTLMLRVVRLLSAGVESASISNSQMLALGLHIISLILLSSVLLPQRRLQPRNVIAVPLPECGAEQIACRINAQCTACVNGAIESPVPPTLASCAPLVKW